MTKSAGSAVLAEDQWTSKEISAESVKGKATQSAALNGPICFVDSEIVFEGQAGVAFESNAVVYLNNVFVRNAKTLFNHTEGGRLAGKPGGVGGCGLGSMLRAILCGLSRV